MMTHFFPTKGKRERFSQADLNHYTRNVPDTGLSPGERIVRHYEAIIKHAGKSNDNSMRGALFEQCIYDALIHFGTTVIGQHEDMSPPSNAEADFIVRAGTYTRIHPILSKTSLRERWKQVDRDARIQAESNWMDGWGKRYGYGEILPRAIVFRENPKDSPDASVRRVEAVMKKIRAPHTKIISAYDEEGMIELFVEFGARLVGPPATT